MALSVDDNGDGRGLHRCGLYALQIVARYSVTPFECCGRNCYKSEIPMNKRGERRIEPSDVQTVFSAGDPVAEATP